MTIPSGVDTIKAYVFYNCTSLTSVTFPSSVTTIAAGAFYNCANITTYDFSAATSVPTLGNVTVFAGTSSSKQIIVPDALYDQWIAATNWSSTDNGIVTSIVRASSISS